MTKKVFILTSLLLVLAASAAMAQGCSMCTQTASQLGDNSARGLNGGIMYLASLPLAILGTMTFVWWKYYKGEKSTPTE